MMVFAVLIFRGHYEKVDFGPPRFLRPPKLLKKVRRYYENNGVVFSGDALDDYDILMEQIAIDLEAVEA